MPKLRHRQLSRRSLWTALEGGYLLNFLRAGVCAFTCGQVHHYLLTSKRTLFFYYRGNFMRLHSTRTVSQQNSPDLRDCVTAVYPSSVGFAYPGGIALPYLGGETFVDSAIPYNTRGSKTLDATLCTYL